MKRLIVVAGVTHRDYLMNEYEHQMRAAGLEYQFEPVEPMPGGPNSMSMRRKADFVGAMATKFRDYDRIVISDAFDVLFYGKAEDLVGKVPETVLISAERNCYPEPNLAEYFESDSPWRFVNAGLMSGSPDMLQAWSGAALALDQLDLLDQQWLNRRAVEHNPLVRLDEETTIFYTVSSTQEDGSLECAMGRPLNNVMDTYPHFFHFSGRCDTTAFREMLVNESRLG